MKRTATHSGSENWLGKAEEVVECDMKMHLKLAYRRLGILHDIHWKYDSQMPSLP